MVFELPMPVMVRFPEPPAITVALLQISTPVELKPATVFPVIVISPFEVEILVVPEAAKP